MRPSRPLRTSLFAAAIVALVAIASLSAQRGYRPQLSYSQNVKYDGRFVFIRLSYPYMGGRMPPWSHDYPRGEEHFLKILNEITATPTHVGESSIMGLSDPELYKFPVAYMCEPGGWYGNSDADIAALRSYLLKGGFVIFDDFRGFRDWSNLELQVSRAFPEGRWVDLDATHPIFHSFFEISSFDIIPQAYDQGRPVFRALYQDNDPKKRMLMIAAFNTDISEFWEWSDTNWAPIESNNEAFKLGVNLFMYGITH